MPSIIQIAKQESTMLRAQYKCQEDDREYLVRQLVFLRKENQRLQEKLLQTTTAAAAAAAATDRLESEGNGACDLKGGVELRDENLGCSNPGSSQAHGRQIPACAQAVGGHCR
jgi:hypothetical protein